MDPLSTATIGLSAAGNVLGFNSAQSQIRSNERIMREQNDFNVKMWRMNNDYNSPASQAARLKAAGINPMILAGGKFQPPAIAASAAPPAYASPDSASNAARNMSSAPIMSMQMVKELELMDAQKRNIDADTKQKLSGAGLNEANTTLLNIDAATRSQLNEATLNQLDMGVESLQQSTEEIKQRTANLSYQGRMLFYDQMVYDERYRREVESWENANREVISRAGLNDAQATEIIRLLTAKVLNLKADTDLKISESTLAAARKLGIDADTQLTGKQVSWFDFNQIKDASIETLNAVGSFVGSAGNIVGKLIESKMNSQTDERRVNYDADGNPTGYSETTRRTGSSGQYWSRSKWK